MQAVARPVAISAPRPTATGSTAPTSAVKAATTLARASKVAPKSPSTPTTRFAAAPEEDKFAAQAARGLAAALRQGGGSVTVRLQPEALGDLKVKVDLAGVKVDASFEVSSDQARKLLDATLISLRSALEARGLEVHRLEVRIADPSPTPQQDAGHNPGGAGGHGGATADHHGSQAWNTPSGHAGPGMERTPSPARDNTGQAHGERPSPPPIVIQSGGAPLMRVRLDAVA